MDDDRIQTRSRFVVVVETKEQAAEDEEIDETNKRKLLI
jgi:hypothetical protein